MTSGILEEVETIGLYTILERKPYRQDFTAKYAIYAGDWGKGEANTLRGARSWCNWAMKMSPNEPLSMYSLKTQGDASYKE